VSGLLAPRAPERADAQVKKNQQKRDGNQELLVIGPVRKAGSVHPQSPGKNNHKKEEEDACDFEPDDSANTAEGAQEAAHAACNSLGRLSSSLTGGPTPSPVLGSGFKGGLAGRSIRGGLCAGGHAFARHAPGDAEADSEGPSDGLRFHSVMMVAATLAQPFF